MSSFNIKTSVAIYLSLFSTLCAGSTTNYTSLSLGEIFGIVIGSLAGLFILILIIVVVCVKTCCETRGRVIGRRRLTTVIQTTATTLNAHYLNQPPGGGMAYGYPVSTAPAYTTYTRVVIPTPGQAIPYHPVNTTATAPTKGVAPLATDAAPDPSSDPPPYPDKC